MSGPGYIAPEANGKCELCGAEDGETRPYGPNGEEVCFTCGMKDEAAAKRAFEKMIIERRNTPRGTVQTKH